MKGESMPSSLTAVATPKHEVFDVAHEEITSLLAPPGCQFVATQTSLEQLLHLAPRHIDDAIARLEDNERDSNGDDCGPLPTSDGRKVVAGRLAAIVSNAIRTLRRNAHGEVGGSGAAVMVNAFEAGEARYKRLKMGFTQLKEHMKELDEHRVQLQQALDRLHADTTKLQQISPSLMTLSSTSIETGFSEGCAVIEELQNILKNVVAKQTSRKLAELKLFQEKLEVREQLRRQVKFAEKRLQLLRAHLPKVRACRHAKSKLSDMRSEIALARQEFQRLHHRLAVMTEALEHVFQFYFQIDQCIAEPELQTVQDKLQRFFQQNYHIYQALSSMA